MFLACCVLPDEKLYGNRLYWCKYVRDINGATQRLKATVPDRRVWLPVPACVIVAVRLSKELKDAHGALKGAKQSARPCGLLLLKIAPREMKHALRINVPVCLNVLYSYTVIAIKNTVYRKQLTTNNTNIIRKYKTYRNRLTHLKEISKQNYYKQAFQKCHHDIKKRGSLSMK